MDAKRFLVHGAGLGLRRAFLGPLVDAPPATVDFYEVAPENWINMGGILGKRFRIVAERFPIICHGLSLSVGGPAPLDEALVRDIKTFIEQHRIRLYSEHLSYCSDGGHLYDLMPIPFTGEAVTYVAARIRRVQEILERRIAIENVSYYAAPGKEMEEIDFLNAVLEEADCDLLLDINNVYVNSINHGYDAEGFLQKVPGRRIAYAHIAGHHVEAEDFIVDTHGAAVVDPVWELLGKAYEFFGVFPTLVERDFNIPPLADLIREVEVVRAIQASGRQAHGVRCA